MLSVLDFIHRRLTMKKLAGDRPQQYLPKWVRWDNMRVKNPRLGWDSETLPVH